MRRSVRGLWCAAAEGVAWSVRASGAKAARERFKCGQSARVNSAESTQSHGAPGLSRFGLAAARAEALALGARRQVDSETKNETRRQEKSTLRRILRRKVNFGDVVSTI